MERPAEQFDALLHRGKAQTAPHGQSTLPIKWFVAQESLSIILDGYKQGFLLQEKSHFNLSGLGMIEHIGQRLLNDAVKINRGGLEMNLVEIIKLGLHLEAFAFADFTNQ